MGLLDFFTRRRIGNLKSNRTGEAFKILQTDGDKYFSYNGKLYKSDIVLSCIEPKVTAVGKMTPKHIRDTSDGKFSVNPDAYMRILLSEPNPYMSMQDFTEKMIWQLALNGNAFAYISRDENGFPLGIYPVPAASCEVVREGAALYLRFIYRDGKENTFSYEDIIHLRGRFISKDILGDSPAPALTALMEIAAITDKGLVNAVKNGGAVRWLLKFNNSIRPEHVKQNTKAFVDDYLSFESETFGAAGVDAKADATQIKPYDYVPNSTVIDRNIKRIFALFATNEKIIESKYNEDEWIAYYESAVENLAIKLSNEFTRKLFTRRQRGFGNHIIFESSNLQYASMQTKLALTQLLDRATMSPNEVRRYFNLAPIAGGDEYMRRLDTAPVETAPIKKEKLEEGGKDGGGEEDESGGENRDGDEKGKDKKKRK